MLDPVKPLTCVTPKRAAALAVSITFSAARRRTPSGSPSPHTSGGSVAPWRASMGSQTAWPTRWVLMAQQFRPLLRSISQRPSKYPLSERALSTSKWSPQHASSSPSKPHSPHFLASSSSVRSAHCPVKSVTCLAMFQHPLTLSTSRTGPDPSLQLSVPRGQKRGHVDRLTALDGPYATKHGGQAPHVVCGNGLRRLAALDRRAQRLQRRLPLHELQVALLDETRLLAPPLEDHLPGTTVLFAAAPDYPSGLTEYLPLAVP